VKRRWALVLLTSASACAAPSVAQVCAQARTVRHVLFVGDSLTHGRYAPVRTYGADRVVDENFGQLGARAESEQEPGPSGGIPAMVAVLAGELGQSWDVHLEAISKASLEKNFAAAPAVIAQAKWDVVVLQEISARPLPPALSENGSGDPARFSRSVETIERAVHAAAPAAQVFLYETWPRGDAPASLTAVGAAYHQAYASAAAQDGHIAGVAPVGDAWLHAFAAGVASADPSGGSAQVPSLYHGLPAGNAERRRTPDALHPSVSGAYLAALVLVQRISEVDVRTLGAKERVAADLGIPPSVAAALQGVASRTVNSP
jgi:lysophospholipase L1-like esterase